MEAAPGERRLSAWAVSVHIPGGDAARKSENSRLSTALCFPIQCGHRVITLCPALGALGLEGKARVENDSLLPCHYPADTC